MQNFVMTLLACSVTMSALALFYMAITPILAKRYSEKGLYYAWLIIIIGLIIPFRPHFNAAIVTVDMLAESIRPIMQIDNEAPITNSIAIENITPTPSLPSIPWWNLAAAVWLAGMIAFFAYHIIKHYRFVKMAERWSDSITNEQPFAILHSIKAELGISKPIGLYTCSSIGSPMFIGFVNPRVLLPKVDFTQDELCFILKHELVHYKRKDLLYKYLVLVATAVHWFNPIVYLMAKAIDIQCELSCDAEVVGSTDIDIRQHYSETIISVVRHHSKLKTALSTNFYGGKRGMKKRIFAIMDTEKKKKGISVICSVFIITMGTGFAFAANTTASIPQSNGITILSTTENEHDKSTLYEKYAKYGLVYDATMGILYFNGEPVRYFEDWYPVGEDGNAYAGVDYFNENGTIDVHGVRDLSQIIHNPDGSYDPSGKLTGIKPYSQMEFDARDLDKLKNSPQASTSVSSIDYSNTAGYYDNSNSIPSGSNFTLSDESKESFKKYSEFDLTYDDDNVFRYHGKTVRRFADLDGGMAFTRVAPNDYDKSVDLTAIRDASGKLTGLLQAGKEEFDQRTKRIEQSRKEQEEFLNNHPNVTAYSTVQTVDSEPSVSNAAGTTYSVRQGIPNVGRDKDTASSYSSNYIDTSLSNYAAYGVSYDNIGKSWMFNGKSIGFLIDSGYQIYANFGEDNTADDFMEKLEASDSTFLKVIRKPNGSIDTIDEMSVDEAVKEIKDVFN